MATLADREYEEPWEIPEALDHASDLYQAQLEQAQSEAYAQDPEMLWEDAKQKQKETEEMSEFAKGLDTLISTYEMFKNTYGMTSEVSATMTATFINILINKKLI